MQGRILAAKCMLVSQLRSLGWSPASPFLCHFHIHAALAPTKCSASGSHFMKQPLQHKGEDYLKWEAKTKAGTRRRKRVRFGELRIADVLPDASCFSLRAVENENGGERKGKKSIRHFHCRAGLSQNGCSFVPQRLTDTYCIALCTFFFFWKKKPSAGSWWRVQRPFWVGRRLWLAAVSLANRRVRRCCSPAFGMTSPPLRLPCTSLPASPLLASDAFLLAQAARERES